MTNNPLDKSLKDYLLYKDKDMSRYSLSPQRDLEYNEIDDKIIYELIDKVDWLIYRLFPDEVNPINELDEEQRENYKYMWADIQNEIDCFYFKKDHRIAISKGNELLQAYKDKGYDINNLPEQLIEELKKDDI